MAPGPRPAGRSCGVKGGEREYLLYPLYWSPLYLKILSALKIMTYIWYDIQFSLLLKSKYWDVKYHAYIYIPHTEFSTC